MYIYIYIDIDIYYLISILSVYNLVNFSLREPTWVQALSSSIKCHPGCSCVRCSCCTCVCLAAGHAGCVFIITDKAKAGRGGGWRCRSYQGVGLICVMAADRPHFLYCSCHRLEEFPELLSSWLLRCQTARHQHAHAGNSRAVCADCYLAVSLSASGISMHALSVHAETQSEDADHITILELRPL